MSDAFFERYMTQVANGALTKPGVDMLAHMALGLNGEAGEVADLVKKSQYEGRFVDHGKLKEELGDVLWYLTFLTHMLGMNLEGLALSNIEKLSKRHPHLYAPSRLYA